MRVGDGLHIRAGAVDAGMDKPFGRRPLAADDGVPVQVHDQQILGANSILGSDPNRVLGLDDDAICARNAGADVPHVVGETEPEEDAAGIGNELAKLSF